jgi:hypothetical protein
VLILSGEGKARPSIRFRFTPTKARGASIDALNAIQFASGLFKFLFSPTLDIRAGANESD